MEIVSAVRNHVILVSQRIFFRSEKFWKKFVGWVKAKKSKKVENFESCQNAKQIFFLNSLIDYEQKNFFFALTFEKKSPIFFSNFFIKISAVRRGGWVQPWTVENFESGQNAKQIFFVEFFDRLWTEKHFFCLDSWKKVSDFFSNFAFNNLPHATCPRIVEHFQRWGGGGEWLRDKRSYFKEWFCMP